MISTWAAKTNKKIHHTRTCSSFKSKLNPDLGHQQSILSLSAVVFSDEPLEAVFPLFLHHTLCLEKKYTHVLYICEKRLASFAQFFCALTC